MIAFVFPGQGSQTVGMGKSLYDTYPIAKQIFENANNILGYSLTDICFHGPVEKLKQTQYAQPALFSVSQVVYEILKEKGINPNFVAGHSLGEYSALTAIGALSFESGLKLVAERGRIMAEAGKSLPGTMAAVLGVPTEELQKICSEINQSTGIVVIANYNCPGQIVISGEIPAVQATVSRLKEMKKKAILLPVSGAFHSPLLETANKEFTQYLNSFTIQSASTPVVCNVTAKSTTDNNEIKSNLSCQMVSPVLWESSVQSMISKGINRFIEIGTGNVLSGLIKKINKDVICFQTGDSTLLESTIQQITTS